MTIIGIDLGTTKSVAAVWRNDEPVIIPNPSAPPEEAHLLPSVVALDPATRQWVVGHPALAISQIDPDNVIFSAKRYMGRRYEDEVVQATVRRRHLLYHLEESHRTGKGIAAVVEGRQLTPQEVAAKILHQLKQNAEKFLGHEVRQAVITVPAYFNDSQRQATKDAGRIAGLEVRHILNEPTAACLAFGFRKRDEPRKKIAVYDLGGGTFDISILEVGGGLPFSVLATNGNTFLGGDDLNWKLVDWVLEQCDPVTAQQIRSTLPSLAALRTEAERVKKSLSETSVAQLHVLITDTAQQIEITRTILDELAAPWIAETLVPCRNALQDARINPRDIQEVLLVGGQTRMPAIRKAVHHFFGIKPNTTVHPEQVVGLGAAVQGAIFTQQLKGVSLYDVVPLSLGLNASGAMDVFIRRNERLPRRESKLYSTTRNNQPAVDVTIYQGEHKEVKRNVELATFRLLVEAAPVGTPNIEVVFDVGRDGILNVTARDLGTGNEKSVLITDSIRLSDAEIQTLIKEAEADSAVPDPAIGRTATGSPVASALPSSG